MPRGACQYAVEGRRMMVRTLCEFRVRWFGRVVNGKGASGACSHRPQSVQDGCERSARGGALPLTTHPHLLYKATHHIPLRWTSFAYTNSISPLSSGAGVRVFWRRCAKWGGTCAAGERRTKIHGAGPQGKTSPAPRRGETCAKVRRNLHQGMTIPDLG